MIFIFYLFVENEVCEIIVVINYDPTLSRQVNRFPSSILLAAKFWHLLNSSNFVLNVFGVWEREFLINYQIFWWFTLKVIKKEDILFLAISSSPPNFFVTYFLSFLQSIYLLFLSFNMLTTFSTNLPLYIYLFMYLFPSLSIYLSIPQIILALCFYPMYSLLFPISLSLHFFHYMSRSFLSFWSLFFPYFLSLSLPFCNIPCLLLSLIFYILFLFCLFVTTPGWWWSLRWVLGIVDMKRERMEWSLPFLFSLSLSSFCLSF